MQIVVTGGGTPLGQALIRAITARGALVRAAGDPVPVRRLIAVDRTQPPQLFVHPLVEYVCGNFEQSRFLARMMGTSTDSIFHLSALGAAATAGPQLEDLEQALLHSLETTRALVDACQYQAGQPRVVFASTLEARAAPDGAPSTTDGICAALCELYLVESARRGFVDLRSVRLPLLLGGRSSAGAIALEALRLAPAAGGAATPAPGDVAVMDPDEAAAALVRAHELPRAFPSCVRLLEEAGRELRPGEWPAAAAGGVSGALPDRAAT